MASYISRIKSKSGSVDAEIMAPDKDVYIDWLDSHLQYALSRMVKFFQFGISDDGHVYCDMPRTWKFLKISWDEDPNSPTFGHIIMEY